MPDKPLIPFQTPSETLAHLNLPISNGALFEAVLLAVFALWVLFTIVATYHWLRYSHASVVAFPSIFLHLVVSVALMSFALSGHFIPTL